MTVSSQLSGFLKKTCVSLRELIILPLEEAAFPWAFHVNQWLVALVIVALVVGASWHTGGLLLISTPSTSPISSSRRAMRPTSLSAGPELVLRTSRAGGVPVMPLIEISASPVVQMRILNWRFGASTGVKALRVKIVRSAQMARSSVE